MADTFDGSSTLWPMRRNSEDSADMELNCRPKAQDPITSVVNLAVSSRISVPDSDFRVVPCTCAEYLYSKKMADDDQTLTKRLRKIESPGHEKKKSNPCVNKDINKCN